MADEYLDDDDMAFLGYGSNKPNPQNQAYWKKRLANQGQIKAAPERPLWRRFIDNVRHTIDEYGPGPIIGDVIAPIFDEAIAPVVDPGTNKPVSQRRQERVQKRRQRREDFQAVDPANSAGDYAADIAGSILGSIISDPTNLIGGPAKTLGGKAFQAAGIGAGLDLAQQGAEVATGVRDELSPEQAAINLVASPVFVAGQHGAAKAWDRFGPKKEPGSAGPNTVDSPEDPIDSRIRKLDDLANHPNTPKNEAEAARRMAAKLRERHGRSAEQVVDSPEDIVAPSTGPIGIEDAASFAKRFGTVTSTKRSAKRNKQVGGVPNSYHLSGRAMDIARKPGVSHKQIEAALRRAGYNIVESLDEGDHSHFAFNFQKSSVPEKYVGRGEIDQPANDIKQITPADLEQKPFVFDDEEDLTIYDGEDYSPDEDVFDVNWDEELPTLTQASQELGYVPGKAADEYTDLAWSKLTNQQKQEALSVKAKGYYDTVNADLPKADVIPFPVVPRIEAITGRDPMKAAGEALDAAYEAYQNGTGTFDDYMAADKAYSEIWKAMDQIGPGTDNPNVVSYSRAKADKEMADYKRKQAEAKKEREAKWSKKLADLDDKYWMLRTIQDQVDADDPSITIEAWEDALGNYSPAKEIEDFRLENGLPEKSSRIVKIHKDLDELIEKIDDTVRANAKRRAQKADVARRGEIAKYNPRPEDVRMEIAGVTPVNDKHALKRREHFIKDASGKPRVFYHGTDKVFEGMPDPEKNRIPKGMTLFTTDRKFAENYAMKRGNPNNATWAEDYGSRIFPVYIDKEGIADFRNPKDVDRVYDWYKKNYKGWNDGVDDYSGPSRDALEAGDWHYWENPDMLRDLGYKGTYMTEYGGSGGSRALNIAIFDKTQAVSKFEMIDPTPDRNTIEPGFMYPPKPGDSFAEREWEDAGYAKGGLFDDDPRPITTPEGFDLTALLKGIMSNEEGTFRPDEFWRALSNWRSRKDAYESGAAQPNQSANPLTPVLDRLFAGVKAAKKASPAQKKAYREERAKRVAEMLRTQQFTSGVEGLKAEKAKLKGELPKVDLEPIRDQFTPEEIDNILEDVKASKKLSPLENVTVRDAIDNLMDGKLPTPGELHLIYRVYPQLVDSILTQRSTPEKIKNFLRMAWETSRGSMGSGDVSFTGRQGFMMLSRPEWWRALRDQFKALSPANGDNVLGEQTERMVANPYYRYLKKLGIDLMDVGGHGNRDEFAVHNLAEMKYSPTKHIVKASNRAYTYAANELRAGLAMNMLQKHKERGIDIDDESYQKVLGEYINAFTGRGTSNWKALERAMPLLNVLFFAPRFVLSTFKRFSPILWGKMMKHPAILKEAARDSGAYLLTLFGVLALADEAGYEVSYDIRSPTGLKIKHGNTTYDVGAGMIQTANLLSKIATDTKITGKGEVKDLKNTKFGEDDLYDVATSFARSKFHPMLAYLVDYKTGTNIVGEDFNPLKDTAELFIPLYSSSMAEHLQDVGPEGLAAAPFAAFGGGMNTYKGKKAEPVSDEEFFSGTSDNPSSDVDLLSKEEKEFLGL